MRIEYKGCCPGFQKIAHTNYLRTLGLSLKKAKSITDTILMGGDCSIEVSDNHHQHLQRIVDLGAMAVLTDS